MPTDIAVIVAGIALVFIVFGAALAWADAMVGAIANITRAAMHANVFFVFMTTSFPREPARWSAYHPL